MFEVTGKNPLLEIALELERIALEDEYFVTRKLYPNVDFYSGLIYQAMGFPVDMFPVLFAIPRTAGWIAQWEEMLLDPEQKIARPRQIYIGLGQARLRARARSGAERDRAAMPMTALGPLARRRRARSPSPACAPGADARGAARFDGARAFEHLRQLVAIGPRVAGTPGARADARLHPQGAEGAGPDRQGAAVRGHHAGRQGATW